ncbi:beta strand repeat-containing protein, partial [Treponema sp. R6D11]
VTVTATNKSKVFGEADPANGYTTTPASIPGSPTVTVGSYQVTGTAGTTRPVGTYTITPQNFSFAETAYYKYTVTYATGTLTVSPLTNFNPTIDNIPDQDYNGSAKTPTIVVRNGSTTLVLNTDYTVTYSNNVNQGVATVNVTFKGNYGGTASKTFNIIGMMPTYSLVQPAFETGTGAANDKIGNSVAAAFDVGTINNSFYGDAYINVAGDYDYWKFTAGTTGTYYMFSSNNPNNWDLYGYLYNSSGSQLTYNDDSGGNMNFYFSYSLQAGQTYYVMVRGYSSSTSGAYRVNINRIGLGTSATEKVTVPYTGSAQSVGVTSNSGGAITVLYNGSTTIPTNAGTYTITVNQAQYGNYRATTGAAAGTFVISKANQVITITAKNLSKNYGAADPAWEYTMSPAILGGGTLTVGSYSVTGTAGMTRPAGTYTITPQNFSIAATANYTYTITHVAGTLTVNKLSSAIVIKANNISKNYGVADPASPSGFTYSITGSLYDGATITVGSYAIENKGTGTGTTRPAGDYVITPSGFSVNNGTNTSTNYNYTITYDLTGKLTVNKVMLTLSANDKTKAYGAADPAWTALSDFTFSGFVNSQTTSVLTGVPAVTISGTAGNGRSVGTYTVTPTVGTMTATNYDFTYTAGNTTYTTSNSATEGGTIQVTTVTLTLSANDKTKVYGAEDPTWTTLADFTFSGFVNSESSSNLSGVPAVTISGTAGTGRAVNTYTVTPAIGTLASTNYVFNFTAGNTTYTTSNSATEGGTMQVTKANLTVTPNQLTKNYGAADPTWTGVTTSAQNNYTISGFVNSENFDSIKSGITGALSTPTISGTSGTGRAVGNYTVATNINTLACTNYTFVTATHSIGLVVNKVNITITPNKKTKMLGDADPTWMGISTSSVGDYTLSGFVNSENFDSIKSGITGAMSEPTISGTAGTTRPVGTYSVTAVKNTLDAVNYAFIVSAAVSDGLTVISNAPANEFAYTGSVQSITLQPGTYKLETWGAQGGDTGKGSLGGRGGYSTGILTVTSPTTYYIYVGGQGGSVAANVGGAAAGGGGGTDIRTSTAQLSPSADSRIIIAGGGGGANGYTSSANGGYGGGNSVAKGGDGVLQAAGQNAAGGGGLYGYNGGGGGAGTEGGGAGGNGYGSGTNKGGDGYGSQPGIGVIGSSSTSGGGGGGGFFGGGGGGSQTSNSSGSNGSATGGGVGGGGSVGNAGSVVGNAGGAASGQYAGAGGWNGGGGGGNQNNASAFGGSGGGGGRYGGGGGGGAGGAGGGGSGWISSILASPSCIAGNASMPAPTSGNETGHSGNGYVKITALSVVGAVANFDYTGAAVTKTLTAGQYKLEVWGAQGGNAGGKGGYSVGTVTIDATTNVYIYVGGQGGTSGTANVEVVPGGFNGGGAIQSQKKTSGSGGGASDIRIGANNLYNRVIVAGGGGGRLETRTDAGVGGGTTGGGVTGFSNELAQARAVNVQAGGQGTQTWGGNAELYATQDTADMTYQRAGGFGIGANYYSYHASNTTAGAGGAGWYGGGSNCHGSGGGGSGWIYTASAFATWNAGRSAHASNYALATKYYLANANMYAGDTSFPATTTGNETGHAGNGYVRITPLTNGANVAVQTQNFFQKILTFFGLKPVETFDVPVNKFSFR